MFDNDDGSVSLIFFTILIFEGLTVQLEYLIIQYLDNTQLHTSKA